MKTITEFDGIKMGQAVAQYRELTKSLQPARPEKGDRKGSKNFRNKGKKQAEEKAPAETAVPPVETTAVETAPATEAAVSVENSSTPEAALVSETDEASVQESAPVNEIKAESVTPSEVAPATETPAMPAGPTPEEILADAKSKIAESFKMEGEKLDHFWNAIKVVQRRSQYLKRVVVMTLNDGEKAPQYAEQVDGAGAYYLPEYFPMPPRPDKGKDFKGRGDGRGKGKGKGGKGGKGRFDKKRRPRRPDGQRGPGAPDATGAQAAPKKTLTIPVISKSEKTENPTV